MKYLGLAGRSGSGKDYVLGILKAAFPTVELVSVSGIIAKYIVDHNLTPDGKIDRRRDVPLMQKLGGEMREQWCAQWRFECKFLREIGKIPVVSAMRTDADERTAKGLGIPIVVVTAPRDVRIQRIMYRDHLSLEEALARIDDPDTEAYVDKLEADFTFNNNGHVTERELSRLFAFLDAIR